MAVEIQGRTSGTTCGCRFAGQVRIDRCRESRALVARVSHLDDEVKAGRATREALVDALNNLSYHDYQARATA